MTAPALPSMVRTAAAALARAESAAEVLAARELAGEAYDRAKRAARLAEAKGAHDSLVAAAHRAQADALEIEAAAKRRLADEYDAAQARGEVQRHGGDRSKVPDGNLAPSVGEIGLTRKDVFEARQLRDAIAERPGLVRQALDQMLAQGDAPTRAALKRIVAPVARTIRDSERAESRRARAETINAIASRGQAATAGPDGRPAMPRAAYPVLYADPPWEQEAWSDETGQDRGLMYPAMPLDEIVGLFSAPPLSGKPLAGAPCANDRSPATPDAVLFLWVTANRLDDGMKVLHSWGFAYVTCLVWDKVTIGMGRWVRDRHEILLIGRRGNFPAPLPGTQPASVHAEKKGRHSEKPAHFAEMIERLYPDMPKLELFCRTPRPGWGAWGFEASVSASRSASPPAAAGAPAAHPAAAGVPSDDRPGADGGMTADTDFERGAALVRRAQAAAAGREEAE